MTTQLRPYATAIGLGLVSGLIAVGVLVASVFLTTYDGFVVVGAPVWFASGCLITARMIADTYPEPDFWSVFWAVSFGLFGGAVLAGCIGTAVALTWLLRLPYAVGLVFICTAAAVASLTWPRTGYQMEY